MIFTSLGLAGACRIDPERRKDPRGYFARTFCAEEFRAHGLRTDIAQGNVSWNERRGTLRGMHFQRPPRQEAKLVRCSRGAVYDVIVDLRRHSPTYLRWEATELSFENGAMLYVPEGFAHGFQTLCDDVEVTYQMFEFYVPALADGVRWDDPALGIRWPLPNPILSERDRSYPLLGAGPPQ